MNLDEFQCPSNGNNNNNNLAAINNDIASKQFHPYTNGGIFNGKMLSNSTANFAFPYDKQQHQHQHMNGGMRSHDGLLKQCYDFPATTTTTAKTEPLDDNFNAGFATKKSSSQNALFSTPSGGGGFMNQFAHHDYSNHQAFTAKINEINNNNSGGGIVVKLENGGSDYSAAMQQQLAKSELLCPRASTMVVSKTEPNEFRSSSCKDNNNHVDINDDERKTSLHSHDHDSNDGFTQL